MTLKSKFLELYHKFAISDEWEGSLEDDAVKIADDFAIGFAEWLVTDWHNDERWSIINDRKELLEIYKKEKSL